MSDTQQPALYFSGPWDGQPVLIDDIPLAEVELKPAKILTGWNESQWYEWNEDTGRYEWRENPNP